MKQYLTPFRKTFQRLLASHEVPASSREVTVAFNFIGEPTLFLSALPSVRNSRPPSKLAATKNEKQALFLYEESYFPIPLGFNEQNVV
jgi:hypothetical protein